MTGAELVELANRHELWIVVGIWAVFLAVVRAGERFMPARAEPRGRRWGANLALGAASAVTGRLLGYWLLPALAVLLAPETWTPSSSPVLPAPARLVAEVLALDLAHYLTHRALHAVPAFWAVHRVHHSDTHVDASTGLRSHPLEAVIVTVPMFAVVWAGDVSPAGVVLYVLLRAALDVVNHGNISLPRAIDRRLRLFAVTPDVHRLHHSCRRPETDSNYGGLFTLWDRLFGSYRRAAVGGRRRMQLGLPGFRAAREQRLGRVLRQPFLRSR
jgi:sterol desaturase/sphingolipid hydroxylase (fatty acid hydroxylase superfamily)